MTAWANNFNGITSGTTVTTGNSGGVSGTAFNTVTAPSGGSLTAQSAAAEEGACGLQIVYPATNTLGYVGWNATAAVGVRLSASFWFKFASLPTSNLGLFATTPAAGGLSFDSSGRIVVSGVAGVVATSTAVTAGTWAFVQFAITANTTTTGRIECIVTTAAGATVLTYDSGATINAGTNAISSVTFGHNGFATQANTFSYDLLAADNTLTSGFPGAAAPTPAGGNIKIWNGTAWVVKPVKIWNGTAWVTKPVKRWNGTAWVRTSY